MRCRTVPHAARRRPGLLPEVKANGSRWRSPSPVRRERVAEGRERVATLPTWRNNSPPRSACPPKPNWPGCCMIFLENCRPDTKITPMKTYNVQLEISGATALWTRPDSMPNPVSYVAPTFSAVKGIFEAVLRWQSVNVRPTQCEVCAPVQFHRYATNYGGPMRKSGQIKKGASLQMFAQVLVNVCYRLHAEVDEVRRAPDGTFAPHAYQDAFYRRLERGQWFYTPCLGWKEFVPDYVGTFREGTTVCATENHSIPTMLKTVFNRPQNGERGRETYLRQIELKNGVLLYA